jgi:hypothetical protein
MTFYDPQEEREIRALRELTAATLRGLNARLDDIERHRREAAELRVLEAQRDAQTWRPTDS